MLNNDNSLIGKEVYKIGETVYVNGNIDVYLNYSKLIPQDKWNLQNNYNCKNEKGSIYEIIGNTYSVSFEDNTLGINITEDKLSRTIKGIENVDFSKFLRPGEKNIDVSKGEDVSTNNQPQIYENNYYDRNNNDTFGEQSLSSTQQQNQLQTEKWDQYHQDDEQRRKEYEEQMKKRLIKDKGNVDRSLDYIYNSSLFDNLTRQHVQPSINKQESTLNVSSTELAKQKEAYKQHELFNRHKLNMQAQAQAQALALPPNLRLRQNPPNKTQPWDTASNTLLIALPIARYSEIGKELDARSSSVLGHTPFDKIDATFKYPHITLLQIHIKSNSDVDKLLSIPKNFTDFTNAINILFVETFRLNDLSSTPQLHSILGNYQQLGDWIARVYDDPVFLKKVISENYNSFLEELIKKIFKALNKTVTTSKRQPFFNASTKDQPFTYCSSNGAEQFAISSFYTDSNWTPHISIEKSNDASLIQKFMQSSTGKPISYVNLWKDTVSKNIKGIGEKKGSISHIYYKYRNNHNYNFLKVNESLTRTPALIPNNVMVEQIISTDFKINDEGGGGDCLFRCIASYVKNDNSQHFDVRQEICDYIDKSEELKMASVLPERGNMRNRGTWGTELEIRGASLLYNIPIVVYKSNNNITHIDENLSIWASYNIPDYILNKSTNYYKLLHNIFVPDTVVNKTPLILWNINDGHFQVLIKKPTSSSNTSNTFNTSTSITTPILKPTSSLTLVKETIDTNSKEYLEFDKLMQQFSNKKTTSSASVSAPVSVSTAKPVSVPVSTSMSRQEPVLTTISKPVPVTTTTSKPVPVTTTSSTVKNNIDTTSKEFLEFEELMRKLSKK